MAKLDGTKYAAEAEPGQTENEIEARQGTDKPKGMPIVLIVSIIGAIVAMGIAWSVFAPG